MLDQFKKEGRLKLSGRGRNARWRKAEIGSDSSLSVVPRKWQVKLQFHLIVQDSTDLDDMPVADAVEEEVTTAPTAPRDVQCPEARHDVVAGLRPRYARVFASSPIA